MNAFVSDLIPKKLRNSTDYEMQSDANSQLVKIGVGELDQSNQ